MMIETLLLALRAIRRNVLRSFLTLLGVVIGVGAVIAMVTIGNGTTAKVKADLGRLGSNLLFVNPGQFGPGRSSAQARPFNNGDVEGLRSDLAGVKAVAPGGSTTTTIVFGTESHSGRVTGTDNAYFITQNWQLVAGREFLDAEVRGGRAACILGATVSRLLFGADDPIGRSVRVKKVSCEVIGVLAAKGQSAFGSDQDDIVIMPLRAFQRRISGKADIANIDISAEDGVDTAKLQSDIERLLRQRRRIGPDKEDDFTVRDTKQLIETQTTTTTLLTGLLGAVAGVSLLVGGIGIMNIMLVSVTERTREIGVRLAIGALERQVLLQFLVEAVVLSLLGGLIGITLGLALAWLATRGLGVPFTLDPAIVLVAFGFSAVVGILFGYFPARRAARMDPIEALRHE